jgi:hypothetical protein
MLLMVSEVISHFYYKFWEPNLCFTLKTDFEVHDSFIGPN